MFELLDNAIGIYHQMFDFFGVRIPFYLFLLALIKHHRVYLSQLGPLGLNKSDWFYFAKRYAPSPVCIDDNRSSINDPWPAAGSFNMADVHHLIIGIHGFLCLPEWTGAERTRSALAQSSGSTTRPGPFMDDFDNESDDDDDACVEIPLVTPIRSANVIPSLGNHGGSFAALAAEGLITQDSRGKGIMVDNANAPSVGANRPRPSSGLPLCLEISPEILFIWTSFLFLVVLIMLPTLKLTAKMSVLHCMMMSHGGELLARYHGLLQSHHEYVLSTDSRLKGYEERVAGLT
nr:hypothetical protein [Tanacetum cinerariifolium]